MKAINHFSSLLCVFLLILSSCGEANGDKDPMNDEPEVKKIDACELISSADLSSIAGAELNAMETTWLEGNDFYHYVSLCGFFHGDIVVTIRFGQRKVVVDPIKRRDTSVGIQKEDPDISSAEAVDVNGLPGLYYEEKDADINLTMNVLMFYSGQFETTLICTQDISKTEMLKISEKMAASVVAKTQ